MEIRWELIAPLVAIQCILMAVALIDLYKNKTIKESKWVWVLIIVAVNVIGPVLYFIIGRRNRS